MKQSRFGEKQIVNFREKTTTVVLMLITDIAARIQSNILVLPKVYTISIIEGYYFNMVVP
jgi:hypothetical protein